MSNSSEKYNGISPPFNGRVHNKKEQTTPAIEEKFPNNYFYALGKDLKVNKQATQARLNTPSQRKSRFQMYFGKKLGQPITSGDMLKPLKPQTVIPVGEPSRKTGGKNTKRRRKHRGTRKHKK
jgi:hypothetical protein